VNLKWFRRLLAGSGVLVLAACGGSTAAPPASSPAAAASAASKPAAPASAAGSASAAAKPAASASAAAKPGGSAAAGATARLGSSQLVVGNAPVWMPTKAGLFAKNGVNVDMQSMQATIALKQVVAGQLDGMVGGSPEAITAKAAGSPVTIVAVFQNKYDMFMTTAKAITSVDQIKGKTVGVINKPSVNGVGTVATLNLNGMQAAKDYTLIETGSAGGAYASLFAAMQAKQVDAGALPGDLVRKVTANGDFRMLYDLAKQDKLLSAGSTLTFRTEYVQQHPAETQKILDSFMQGAKYFKDHPDEAKALLKESFKIDDPTDLEQAYQRQLELASADPTPRPELYTDLINVLGAIEPDVKTLDLSTLLDPKFAQDAVKRGMGA
jgi:ABC-type nitrate/sulfonate/bicarbonate transport system substrate-binding protein